MKTLTLIVLAAAFLAGSGCASSPQVKTQAYAGLKNTRTFEHEFPVVWKGIESALKNYRITERDPTEVDTLEMAKLKERNLETDWVYSQSRDKYQEYQVNGSPRKKYLQARYKYKVQAKRVMGGTEVVVKTEEEIEKLKSDGASDGFSGVDADSSRANEILEKINNAILAAAP